MAHSDKRMNSAARVVLTIVAGSCVLGLASCGSADRAIDDSVADREAANAEADDAEPNELDQMYALGPQKIARLTASIIEIQIPPRYEADAGEDFSSAGILRRQVHYLSSDYQGNILIREMLRDDVTTREAALRTLVDELKNDSWIFEFDSAAGTQRTFTIGGEECVFEFQSGNDPTSGDARRQAFGAVPSGGGIAYVVVNDTAANWDEDAIVAMLQSIKVGQGAPASDPSPTASGSPPDAGDSPTESPR